MDAPPEVSEALLAARAAYDDSPVEVRRAIREVAGAVRAGVGLVGHPLPSPVPHDANGGVAQRYGDVLGLLACVPSMFSYHADHGVPGQVSWATLADLPRHVLRHRQLFGQPGFSELGWLTLHLRGLLYDLGRLQFERVRRLSLPDDWAAMTARIGPLADDDVLLNVHIPATGPLDPDACQAAYDRAVRELPVWFPEERARAFCCQSWLLDPQLGDYLRPDSNILRFQQRFEIVGAGAAASRSMQEFVFARPGDVDLDTLPRTSTLERAFVDHLRAGGTWSVRTGWCPLDTW
jgi:hypothetical protein